jgi:hypothetical protein
MDSPCEEADYMQLSYIRQHVCTKIGLVPEPGVSQVENLGAAWNPAGFSGSLFPYWVEIRSGLNRILDEYPYRV